MRIGLLGIYGLGLLVLSANGVLICYLIEKLNKELENGNVR